MDENGNPIVPPPATTTKERFKGFAVYHLASFLFAAPSSCFVLCSFRWISGYSGFLLAVLFAAVLPPLLFALGSFWQAKRQKFLPER